MFECQWQAVNDWFDCCQDMLAHARLIALCVCMCSLHAHHRGVCGVIRGFKAVFLLLRVLVSEQAGAMQ
jgi:hypothetical protein